MDPFVWRLVLSFVVGGLYATSLMWISEKFGSKVGGILTGIPTTVFIGLTFIALTAGNAAAHQSALIIPAMAGVSLVLVYCFMQFIKLGPESALAIAVAIWFIIALLFVHLHLSKIIINIVIGAMLMFITRIATLQYPHNLKASVGVLQRTYVARAIGAGSVIAGAVIIARVAGPVWGGAFAAFPATFVTTLYVLSKAQGPEFAKAVAKQLPLANGSTLSFAVIFYLLIIPAGLLAAVIAAVAGSLTYAILLLKLSKS